MRKLVFMTFISIFLCGCTNIEEIQYEAYAVGLGIDYKDNEYHVTLQFLDFSNVAKTEQGKSDQPGQVWLGEGKGETVEDAFTKIYQGIQIPVNYDQISVFVFGKSLLENKLDKTLQGLDTNFNIRLTGLAYGTEKPINEIFTTKVPFNYPFTVSRMSQPEYMQEQYSSIPPVSLQELIYQFNEHTKTILLPNISINEEIMKKDMENIPVTTFNGAFMIKDEEMKGLLTNNDLTGFIHVNNESDRTTLVLNDRKEEHVQIELLKPKLKRIMKKNENDIVIGLHIKVSAIIRESSENILSKKMKKQLEKEIKNKAYEAYMKSKEMGGDIFQFEDYIYRYMHNDWKKLHENQEFPTLEKEDIHVSVRPLKSINKINSGINPLIK
ncbi:Ger(x)C family spore germination protein [Metabacillus sediminilitoris]|uniref:Ger(X)C family spore germination protein n=1 Tax=Metabacillus sediminilitoris TaxID=2567941 RepID=A0A4S4BS77_9BACI|nr:Ger(x)C family spore germination protein [Metabacillus sediminilitoris]QGQ48496.1 Ger(x)C family spore germination protein [Metabacillus sediminilitoris]THF77883.1 Ger(x)C family spore germination protein [Metabacillus sediminilitoris]